MPKRPWPRPQDKYKKTKRRTAVRLQANFRPTCPFEERSINLAPISSRGHKTRKPDVCAFSTAKPTSPFLSGKQQPGSDRVQYEVLY